jgi:hypothetical protein
MERYLFLRGKRKGQFPKSISLSFRPDPPIGGGAEKSIMAKSVRSFSGDKKRPQVPFYLDAKGRKRSRL